MAKISKNEFKKLVKECLAEILAEGLGNVDVTVPKKKLETKPAQWTNKGPAPKAMFEQRNRQIAEQKAGGDPIMASIFQDTMETSMQQMPLMTESDGAVLPQSNLVEHVSFTPDEIFGEEETARWANLAFAPSFKKHAG